VWSRDQSGTAAKQVAGGDAGVRLWRSRFMGHAKVTTTPSIFICLTDDANMSRPRLTLMVVADDGMLTVEYSTANVYTYLIFRD
jgi:hypothetical protein